MKVPYLEQAAAELERRLPPGSLRARLAKGATWSLIGTVISQGLALLASIVVARVLGKVGYGELGMVRSTVGMFGVFAGLGLGLTATKYVAEFQDKDPARAGRIIGLSLAVSVLTGSACALAVCYFAPALATHAINAPHLTPELRIATLLLLFNALTGVQTGVLAGFEAFRTIAYTNLFRGLASFPLVVAGVLLAGLPGAIWGFVLTGAVALAVNQVFLRRESVRHRVRLSYRGILSERRILWGFSLPAFLSGALPGPANWGAGALLVNQPGGYGQLGLFNAARHWLVIATFLPSTVLQVALPVLSSVVGQRNERGGQFSKTLEVTQSIGVALVFPVSVAFMFLSGAIMGLYGPGFREGAGVLVVVASTAMIMATGSATGPAIQAQGRMWLALAINLSWAVTMVAFTWATVPVLGALSIALGNAVGYLFVTVWAFRYLAPALPLGMLRRVYGAMGFAIIITLLCFLSPTAIRPYLAGPALAVTLYAVLAWYMPDQLRSRGLSIARSVRAWLKG